MSDSRLVLLMGDGDTRLVGRPLGRGFEEAALDVRSTLEDGCPIMVVQDAPSRRAIVVTRGLLDRGLAILTVEEVPDGD